MSYSIRESKLELETAIATAFQKRDGDALLELAQQLDEDEADPLLYTVRKWREEDEADNEYDQAVDNGII